MKKSKIRQKLTTACAVAAMVLGASMLPASAAPYHQGGTASYGTCSITWQQTDGGGVSGAFTFINQDSCQRTRTKLYYYNNLNYITKTVGWVNLSTGVERNGAGIRSYHHADTNGSSPYGAISKYF